MQVKVELDKVTVVLGSHGIVLKIADNSGKHVGNLRIGKATVVWMRGKTQEPQGVKIPMAKFIKMLDEA